MPSVITNIWGILKKRSALSSSLCLVVRVSKITSDTEVTTLVTNKTKVKSPCRVIISFILKTLKINNGSPGLKTLNSAGTAIKSENKGMKIHVLLRKNKILIPEKKVNPRTKKNIPAIR